MPRTLPPGQPQPDNQAVELEFWKEHLSHWDLHIEAYARALPLDAIDFAHTSILDVGSGPISVFEKMAPKGAIVVAYDSLAEDTPGLLPPRVFPCARRFRPINSH